jgi:Holliday junction resolvase RusA-like endonuclease
MTDLRITAVSVTYSGPFVPYVRMTQRGKFVVPRALEYQGSQAEIKARFKEQLIRKGHRAEDLPIFKNGQPIRALLLVSMSAGLHKQDLDNQTKAILDAAQGLLFENDLWIDAISVERSLGKTDEFELIVSVHPPEWPPEPEIELDKQAVTANPYQLLPPKKRGKWW